MQKNFRKQAKTSRSLNIKPVPRNKRKIEKTGLIFPPFTQKLKEEIEGELSYKPPRTTERYKEIEAFDLTRKVQSDIDELLGRIRENFPQNLPLDKLSKMEEERLHIAHTLVYIVTNVIERLEHLSMHKDTNELMKKVARRSPKWPVNFTVKLKKNGKIEFPRIEFIKAYIQGLEVGIKTNWGFYNADDLPFQVAAKKLYHQLLLIKFDIQLKKPLCYNEETRWITEVKSLPERMTMDNCKQWWKVAKIYIEEVYSYAPEQFEVLFKLIGHTKKNTKALYNSEIKRDVIDVRLKSAFRAFAKDL